MKYNFICKDLYNEYNSLGDITNSLKKYINKNINLSNDIYFKTKK